MLIQQIRRGCEESVAQQPADTEFLIALVDRFELNAVMWHGQLPRLISPEVPRDYSFKPL